MPAPVGVVHDKLVGAAAGKPFAVHSEREVEAIANPQGDQYKTYVECHIQREGCGHIASVFYHRFFTAVQPHSGDKNELARVLSKRDIMWLLRNGRRIRVLLYIDPCWTAEEQWSLFNRYAKGVATGLSSMEAESAAAAAVWKSKWPAISYR